MTSDTSRVQSTGFGPRILSRALLDARLDIDFDTLWGWKGLGAFVQYYAKVGGNGAEYAPTIQGFSNIDAESFGRRGEMWVEQRLESAGLRVKAGRIDANTEFAAVTAAADFLNPSMGYSPTIGLFPTYPDPRLGVVGAVEPTPFVTAAVGLFRAFAIGELRSRWTLGSASRPGQARVGVSRYTGRLDPVEGGGGPRPSGLTPYVALEQTVWQDDRAGEDRPRNVGVFVQYGAADRRVYEIDRHVGAGVVARGAWRRRPSDLVGLGFTATRPSSPPSGEVDRRMEVAVETFLKYEIAPWASVQPDVQFVVYADDGAPLRRRGVFGTCRLRVEF